MQSVSGTCSRILFNEIISMIDFCVFLQVFNTQQISVYDWTEERGIML